jgi:hypothetical protein
MNCGQAVAMCGLREIWSSSLIYIGLQGDVVE